MGNKVVKTLGDVGNGDLDLLASMSYREDLFDQFPTVIGKLELGVIELEQFIKLCDETSTLYKLIAKRFSANKKTEALPTNVLERLTAGLESMASEYLNSAKEMEKLKLDADEVKKELSTYISMAKKEEKVLSAKLLAVRKEEEKIKDKFFDEKQFIQESKSNLIISKDMAEKKITEMNKKVSLSEENVAKLEKEAEVVKRKVKEVSTEYDLKLRNILSHLEFIDRKRFRYTKDLTKRYSQIQANTSKMVIEQQGIVDTKIELLSEENEFTEYISSVKSIKPCSLISADSEQKLLSRISSQSWEFMKVASESLKNNIETGVKYTDSVFPPKNTSIDPQMEDSTLWMRASDLLGPFKIISPETVLMYDIKPSKTSIGNDWLSTALTFIASKSSSLIERVFVVKVPNEIGVYELNMCIGGEFYKIIIDDFFPATMDGNPMFSSTKSKDLWVMAIEKAVAKICGSYKRIGASSFTVCDGFELLTGCPCFFQPLTGISDINLVWKQVSSFTENRNITCCLTLPISDSTSASVGLAPNQPYYLVGCLEMNGKKIVKLKCAKGAAEWKGDYSESDNINWTSEYRNALGVDQTATLDGFFFMPFSDFCKYFDSMSSFKHEPLLARFQHRIPYPSPSDLVPPLNTVTEITLETDQKDLYIGLHQKHDRFKGSPARSAIGFIVVRKQNGKVVAVNKLSTSPCNYSEGLSLRAGDYQIIPIVAHNAVAVDVVGSGNIPNLVVVAHAKGNVRMKTAEKISIKVGSIQKSLVDVFLSTELPKSPSLNHFVEEIVTPLDFTPYVEETNSTSDNNEIEIVSISMVQQAEEKSAEDHDHETERPLEDEVVESEEQFEEYE